MAIYSMKKEKKCAQFLLTISVNGSSGPVRFLVNENDTVDTVINKAVKKFAREGRLMNVFGSDFSKLTLRCVNSGYDALSSLDKIGICECRNFILYKEEKKEDPESPNSALERKGIRNWNKLVKLLGFKIPSH